MEGAGGFFDEIKEKLNMIGHDKTSAKRIVIADIIHARRRGCQTIKGDGANRLLISYAFY